MSDLSDARRAEFAKALFLVEHNGGEEILGELWDSLALDLLPKRNYFDRADRLAPLIAGWLDDTYRRALNDAYPLAAAEREAGAAEVRAQVWNVLNDLIVDHPMWIGDDGQPLDYSPEREARIHDFIREASAALNGGE